MGARSAGNPHAACDVEGAGNVARTKDLPARQPSTLLLGGTMETSASFEARSAPSSYPTDPRRQPSAAIGNQRICRRNTDAASRGRSGPGAEFRPERRN
jgi:hypothetical protein